MILIVNKNHKNHVFNTNNNFHKMLNLFPCKDNLKNKIFKTRDNSSNNKIKK